MAAGDVAERERGADAGPRGELEAKGAGIRTALGAGYNVVVEAAQGGVRSIVEAIGRKIDCGSRRIVDFDELPRRRPQGRQ